MRPTVLGTILILVGVAYSQTSVLPQCAQDCVTKFTTGTQIGSCGNLDAKCICSNQNFLSSIACCLASACNTADQAAAVTYAKQLCTTQGVTVPNAVSCVSSSTTATTTAPPSSSASGSASGSSTGTSVASSPSAALVSTTSSSTSAPATVTKNVGIQNTVGAGMSFAGSLVVLLALF